MADETKEERFDESLALLNSRQADYGDKAAIESNKKLIKTYVMRAMRAGASAETMEAARRLLLSQGSSQDVKAALDLLSNGNPLNLNSNATSAEKPKEVAPTEEIPAAGSKTWIQ